MNREAERYFLLFMWISFLGWVVETLFFLVCYGGLYDRGFMTMPFCTIYGCSFLLLYFLIGTPEEGGVLPRQRSGRRSGAVYFLLCAVLPTGLELVTGILFHRLFNLRLWTYSSYRFHFQGYICLEYALLWGLLIPPCMKYFFLPLKNRVFAISQRRAEWLAWMLGILAVADWSINFGQQEFQCFWGPP